MSKGRDNIVQSIKDSVKEELDSIASKADADYLKYMANGAKDRLREDLEGYRDIIIDNFVKDGASILGSAVDKISGILVIIKAIGIILIIMLIIMVIFFIIWIIVGIVWLVRSGKSNNNSGNNGGNNG
jgi:Flp pilus assembly protein TadB